MMLARLALTAAIVFGAATPSFAAGFTVTSPAFPDGGALSVNGSQPNCGGGTQVSPPLAFSNVPATAQSFAITLLDLNNANPGWAHWVAYGIPGSTSSLAAGFGSQTTAYVVGTNSAGANTFRGYCPAAGDMAHHYVFTVYATDLAPDALAPGLNRDQLAAALKGHVVGVQTIVGKYTRPPS